MDPNIFCIGACHWDIIGRASASMHRDADVPGIITRSLGGVAMNIARALKRFGLWPALLSAVGRDAEGEALIAEAHQQGLCTAYLCRSDAPTDVYLAIEDPNGLVGAIADTRLLETVGAEVLAPLRDGRLGTAADPFTGTLVVDGNLTEDLLRDMADDAAFSATNLHLVAVSPEKAIRLKPLLLHPRLTLYLNLAEASILGGRTFADAKTAAAYFLEHGVQKIIVTDGARAAAIATTTGIWTGLPRSVSITRITGAGDTFLAAHLAAEQRGATPLIALEAALAAAATYISGE